jgi:hypothetical protein
MPKKKKNKMMMMMMMMEEEEENARVPCAVQTLLLDGIKKLVRNPLSENPQGQVFYRIQNFSDFRKVIPCIYRALRNLPQRGVGQHPLMKHITVSAARRMNIHSE